MCVGFWSLKHPKYSLVLCANRDEFLARPTKQAGWHNFGHDSQHERKVLSGIDELAGGTWLGINRRGDIAFLTNITGAWQSSTSSRGALCSTYLLSENNLLEDFVQNLTSTNTLYSGFNLVLFSPVQFKNEISYKSASLSNGAAGKSIYTYALPLLEGGCACAGLSNAVPRGTDTSEGIELGIGEEWTKVSQGKQLMDQILSQSLETSEDELIEELFSALRTRSPDQTRQSLRQNMMIIPVDIAAPKGPSVASKRNSGEAAPPEPDAFSSPSAPPKWYATRLSTVILVRKDGHALFVERDVWTMTSTRTPVLDDKAKENERRFAFHLDLP